MVLKFQASLPMFVFREGDTFIAHSPVLDLSTSANTFDKVQRRFTEVVQIFIEELLEKGTLDEVLSSYGWRHTGTDWAPPVLVSQGVSNVRVSLPN